MRFKILLILGLLAGPVFGGELATQFAAPPASTRPWVYWFWNNANVTKAGITADLEAMKRAGIGGVIIMDVAERFAPPRGAAVFMSPEWRELFHFALAEAKRLGIEINMTNGPGWCGSSGPWITPELSMQMLVYTNVAATGPANLRLQLPRPPLPGRSRDPWDSSVKYNDFYRDIAVLAFPVRTNGVVPRDEVRDLTSRLDAGGGLNWQAPPGRWVIERIGHTSTGSSTRPPVAGNNGLECDKLSRKAMDAHFAGMLAKLIAEAGPVDRQALVATHIDSWEVGSQNWTEQFRKEFRKRRGYDLIRYLPNVLGSQKIGDDEASSRFLWDFNQTRAELLAENYSGRLAKLAHRHGMRLTMEGYDLPFGDEATYTAPVDEPMSEFWTQSSAPVTLRKAEEMASVGHIYGRTVIGAESFTSGDGEKWMLHPALIKALGDFEFSEGINRFVIHRYAHQPYLDRAPGATMGPWGLHYERTETWWEMSSAWHDYLSRCQLMLRQGKFVADLCYLRPEAPMQTYFNPAPAAPAGYKYDECSAQALIERMNVKNGRLTLPDGMSYRLLILPPMKSMTPALARKLRKLVFNGATILANGPAPQSSPSLQGFPKCDQSVAALTRDLWGDCDGTNTLQHAFGRGSLIWGRPIKDALKDLATPADFFASAKLNWIHRRANGREIYFVANPASTTVKSKVRFRAAGLQPEQWNPETGGIEPLAAYWPEAGGVTVPLRLNPSESTFIVFDKKSGAFDPVVSLLRNGDSLFAPDKLPAVEIQSASYGVPGDPVRTRDVRNKIQTMVSHGTWEFQVADIAKGDDPALNVVKTLAIECTIAGRPLKFRGQDPDTIKIAPPETMFDCPVQLHRDSSGGITLEGAEPGDYDAMTAAQQVWHAQATDKVRVELGGPWNVQFPAGWGAPESITLEHLASLSESTNDGVKFFSGAASYTTTFTWGEKPADTKLWLNLGEVQIMAQVKLNGHDLGILWKPPFRLDVTKAVQAGANLLEIRVANLWPNRMIGDAALPEAKRHTWSSWQPFTKNSPLPKSGLLGPVTIQAVPVLTIR